MADVLPEAKSQEGGHPSAADPARCGRCWERRCKSGGASVVKLNPLSQDATAGFSTLGLDFSNARPSFEAAVFREGPDVVLLELE